jgi:uncharacterized protein
MKILLDECLPNNLITTTHNAIYNMENNIITNLIKNQIKNDNSDADVILFGSRARNEATKESDWDILVLLNQSIVTIKDEQVIRHKLFDIELNEGIAISTFVYSKNEWNTRLNKTPLFENIKREGVLL